MPELPFKLHVGDDYLELTLPSGSVLTMRYPDGDDVKDVGAVTDLLNRAAELIKKGEGK